MDDADYDFIQTKESLDFALESGRMATWELDLETDQIYCSKSMLELWGIDLHEFKNQRSTLQKKVHPDDVDRMIIEINQAIKNQSIYELEYRIIPRPDTICWVRSRGRCTYAPNSDKPNRLAGVVYDITEKKEKEIELARALEARSDFFRIAGHELKTPLACLQLQVKVMEYQLKEGTDQETTISMISKGLKKQQDHLLRISKIVDNMLDETNIAEGLISLQLEHVNIAEMVSEVIDQMNLISSLNGIEIKVTCSTNVKGKWDRFRLEQVLFNLLTNAIRYGNNKSIHVEVIQEKNQALIIVRDEGTGISPDDQVKIFNRFERANQDKSIRGMGLGLYISQYIVRAHGGEIRLKSSPGKGSEFTVILPLNL